VGAGAAGGALALTERQRVVTALAGRVAAVRRRHPVRVAIDGVDAAGKTTLADELARHVVSCGRYVIRASADGFHRPRAERYRRGAESPEGYLGDAFARDLLRAWLLDPLGPGGDLRYCTAVFDLDADAPLDAPALDAPVNAVLVVDGVFLLHPELADAWDLRIFVDVPFEEALRRGVERDAGRFGSAEEARRRYERRYLPAQRLYLETVRPRELADVVVDNADPEAPRLV
jgi:uridine kinase